MITPSVPSEPTTSSRSAGPAAVCGVSSVRSSPAGALSATWVTSSSKRPYPLDAWPAERVAAKPPIVAYSKDCGKWPSVTPWAPSAASAAGPRRPGPSFAVSEIGSTATERIRRRSSEITRL